MKYASNIAALADLKPDYLGFIFYDKSPRNVSDVSSELIRYIPKEIKTVGVFVDENLENVMRKVADLDLSAVQLHGRESSEYCLALKNHFSSLEIIKAFGVDNAFEFAMLESYEEAVDFFLFDTKTSMHGGSGKQFDWTILEHYKLNKPYFLSGGIDSCHVPDILNVDDERLVAVDVNSKFEVEPGLKNIAKLEEFFTLIR
ncbi:phosphoribosylanthranilate isomerase [Pedobacter sp. UYEF25]